MTMTALELLRAGRLEDAVTTVTQDVKRNPGSEDTRTLLATLLCFKGDWERADLQFDVLGVGNPAYAKGVNLFRQLVRGEISRREFYLQGRPPACIGDPTPEIRQSIAASVSLRLGDLPAAAAELQKAQAVAPDQPGTCDDEPFDTIRDLDDLTAPVLETVTVEGEYLWIPFSAISTAEFDPVKTLRDLLWRKVRVESRRGSTIHAFVSNLYFGSHSAEDRRLACGHATDWVTTGEPPMTRGIGLRTFMVGDAAKTVLEIGTLRMVGSVREAH